MVGAGIFVSLLLLTVFWVFLPVFSRSGNRPVPAGVEEDPVVELTRQKERLLRQWKEWQLEGAGDAEEGAVQAALQGELAEVMARLDRMPPAGSAPGAGVAERPAAAMGLAAVLAAVLVVAAVLLYLALGRPPGLSGPLAANTVNTMPDQGTLHQAVARLAERLTKEPDNIAGWLQLARSQATLEDEAGAIRSYRHVLSRQPEHNEAAVGLAELLVQSGVEEQMGQGLALLEGVLRRDANQMDALWLVGALSARAGDYARAVALWQRLLPLLSAGSEGRATVENALREARGRLSPP
ncbi:MAG: hypothetical protein HQM06_14230 [Magnetococcales bacterium]|nr:hypothetical protein [Magnetococcales bacterium]